MKFRNVEDVYRYINRIPRFQDVGAPASNFDLNRFKASCAAIGNPQEAFRSVHVGGTNGKGSTCQLIASISQSAGYKTALYTSPHLIDYRERFQIDGRCITDEQLIEFFRTHHPVLEDHRLTYFEISTLLAFWWFARQKVDLAVVEVGLGGRLDATNVIHPLVSVITNVSLDHTDILGATIGEISSEKAGIIKTGVPVITGNVNGEAREIIADQAARHNSPLLASSDLNPSGARGTYRLTTEQETYIFSTGLQAPIQACNIAAAWLVAQQLNRGELLITQTDIREGIAKVLERYPARGRFEQLHPNRSWYFDGAHNLEAVREMKRMIRSIAPLNEATLVLSLMRDKINSSVMKEFLEFEKILYHTSNTERAATLQEVKPWLPDVLPFPATRDQQGSFFNEHRTSLVIFAGSFYFYPTVRDWLTAYASGPYDSFLL